MNCWNVQLGQLSIWTDVTWRVGGGGGGGKWNWLVAVDCVWQGNIYFRPHGGVSRSVGRWLAICFIFAAPQKKKKIFLKLDAGHAPVARPRRQRPAPCWIFSCVPSSLQVEDETTIISCFWSVPGFFGSTISVILNLTRLERAKIWIFRNIFKRENGLLIRQILELIAWCSRIFKIFCKK